MMRNDPSAIRRRPVIGSPAGFSLVELVIAVIIIGVIAALAVPRMTRASLGVREAAIARNLDLLKDKVYETYQVGDGNDWPETIDAAWFARGVLPDHPENRFGVPAIQVLSDPALQHPSAKVLKTGVAGAYWYNTSNGVVRARVADQGSAAATLDLYNRVNHSNESGLGNYGGGGGGS